MLLSIIQVNNNNNFQYLKEKVNYFHSISFQRINCNFIHIIISCYNVNNIYKKYGVLIYPKIINFILLNKSIKNMKKEVNLYIMKINQEVHLI
jgi:hypothetical protein